MGDCDNTNCCYYLNGKCNGARDGYTIENCNEHFVDNDTVGTGEDEDYEDYAFADYDCEYGLFGDE